MTDVGTPPVAAPQTAPPPNPPDTTPAPTPAPATPAVAHTVGGVPAVPLAVTGANTTIGAFAAAALAGGPLGVALAMTGAVVVGTVAATRNHRGRAARRRTTTRTAVTGRSTRSGSAGRVPSQGRSSGTVGVGKGHSRSGAARAGTSGLASGGTAGAKHRKNNRPGHDAGAGRSGQSAGAGRLAQVKALRTSQHGATTRAGQRAQSTAARRAVADTRRAAKADRQSTNAAGKGRAAQTLAKGLERVTQARAGLRDKTRAARDRKAGQSVAAQRSAVRKGPARRQARRAMARSAARLQGRRLLAAALTAPLGVLGAVTTPLGRQLGWRWLLYPGRRLFRRIVANALRDKAARDVEIRAQQEAEEAAADAAAQLDPNAVGDQVERPEQQIPVSTPKHIVPEGVHVSGFNFEQFAAEMESSASSYEPDGCMEILAMVDQLPEALTAVANTLRILAERSDTEFPLEKEVAAGFGDIFQALMTAATAAEELPRVFRTAHEQDIARHEDPRNGPEAEKGWNV